MMNKGEIVSINISTKKGEQKIPVEFANVTNKGLEGDAHSGDWHRQISLLSEKSIDKMRGKGVEIHYGDFAENITIKNLVLTGVHVGQRISIGKEVLLEVTQIGKECHQGCAIRDAVGDCIMPKEGIFAKVIMIGNIRVGDTVILIN